MAVNGSVLDFCRSSRSGGAIPPSVSPRFGYFPCSPWASATASVGIDGPVPAGTTRRPEPAIRGPARPDAVPTVKPDNMKSTRLWRHVAVSVIAAGPVGGFLVGLLNAGDPDPNPIGRVLYAFMMSVVTPLHAGFPPHHAAGAGQFLNAWPHIAVAFLLIFVGLVYRDRRMSHKQGERAA